MELKHLTIPGTAALVLDAANADRLLALRDGDAALLYLFLLRNGGTTDDRSAAGALSWTTERVGQALSLLSRAGLMGCDAAVHKSTPRLEPEGPPEYSAEEIAQEMKDGSPFPALVGDVENRLGRVLSITDLKILFGLYDHLALPPEVISLLVTYCIEDCQRQYGAGRMPRMRQIEKEGYRWQRNGADSAEQAVNHLKRLSLRRNRQGQILESLGITGRSPVPSERKYIDEWLDMGFAPEAVSIAYDRTVIKTGGLKWPYLNSILKSWHEKGLHTPEEIATGDAVSPARKNGRPVPAAASNREAIAWMQEYMKNRPSGDED